MARVKAQFEERRWVPWIGREVDAGEIVEVPDADLASYLEAGWSAAQDKATKQAVGKLDKQPDTGGEAA